MLHKCGGPALWAKSKSNFRKEVEYLCPLQACKLGDYNENKKHWQLLRLLNEKLLKYHAGLAEVYGKG